MLKGNHVRIVVPHNGIDHIQFAPHCVNRSLHQAARSVLVTAIDKHIGVNHVTERTQRVQRLSEVMHR
jgi:hypothetical protein